MSESFVIPRTGDAPLAFAGGLLAESDGRQVNGREQARWHEVAVYRAGPLYVVHVGLRTCWQGEQDHSTAEVFASPAEVVAFLRAHDPTEALGGYPDHPSYAARQEALRRDVSRRYRAQVSEVLADPVFHAAPALAAPAAEGG